MNVKDKFESGWATANDGYHNVTIRVLSARENRLFQFDRILNGLERIGMLRTLHRIKIRHGTGRDNEILIRASLFVDLDLASLAIDPCNSAAHKPKLSGMKKTLVLKHRVVGYKTSGGDLVQERREREVIGLAHERDRDVTFEQTFSCIDTSESSSNDDDGMVKHI